MIFGAPGSDSLLRRIARLALAVLMAALAGCQSPLDAAAQNADINARLNTLSVTPAAAPPRAVASPARATLSLNQTPEQDYADNVALTLFLAPLRNETGLHCAVRFASASGKSGPAGLMGGYLQAQALKRALAAHCQQVSTQHDGALPAGKLAIAVAANQ